MEFEGKVKGFKGIVRLVLIQYARDYVLIPGANKTVNSNLSSED